MSFPSKSPFWSHLRHQVLFFFKVLSLLLLLLMIPSHAGANSTVSPVNAIQTTPEPVLIFFENLSQWQMTSGFIYLTDTCSDGSSQTTAYVQRRAVHGMDLSLLESVNGTPQCRTFRHAAADESGIYYYNRNLGRIEAIYSDTPNDPPTPLATIGDWTSIGFGDGIGALKLDGSFVYWIEAEYGGEFDPAHVRIRRVSKSGGAPTTRYEYTSLAAAQVSFDGLGVTSSHIWWIDGDGLNRIPSCTLIPCSPGPVVKTTEFSISISAVTGVIQVSGFNVFWWNREADRERIRRTSCSFFSGNCSTTSVHLPGSGITVLGLAANGEDAFWTENVPLTGRRLRQKALSGGSAVTIAENISSSAPYLDVDGVYFQTSSTTISRLPLDASAITREIGIAGWEVTQGIQRPANDVPLVAGKATFVRLYPTLEDGADLGSAMAELHGSRAGQPLPGSPLYPINGTIPIDSGLSLANRTDLNGGWLFRLPVSWTRTEDQLIPQQDTTITLRGVIDPFNIYADTDNPANNVILDDFLFTAKAPTCMFMWPVSTEKPAQDVTDINVDQVVELSESVLPSPSLITIPKNTPLRKTDWCWKGIFYGPFCSSPYDLVDDDQELYKHLISLKNWTFPPAICGNNAARTLQAGVIPDDASWGNVLGSTPLIKGDETPIDILVTKVPRYGAWIDRTNQLAMTMVHEIGHNYNRRHISCGVSDKIDPDYKYPVCKLDFDLPLDDPDLHFGFDPSYQEPISPAASSDYMTYNPPLWYSDYTWKAIFNEIDPPTTALAAQNNLAGAGLISISGSIDPENNRGTLDYAWSIPAETAGQDRMQRFTAGRSQALKDRSAAASYHLRLVGSSGQVLLDQSVELIEVVDAPGGGSQPFELTLAAPAATVTGLQLMVGDTILDKRTPSAAQPAVSITQPDGGVSVQDQLTVGWSASDADGDRLLYTIQYSPDQGEQWVPLLVNFGGTGDANETITLDIPDEAGSAGTSALVRVLASDGYNTGMATSQLFNVARRAPFAAITSPRQDHTFGAEETIQVNGIASDPEDGLIADDQFIWSTGQIGQMAELSGLAPGTHNLQLVVTDSDGQEGTSSVSFTVAPLALPETSASFILDGRCDDPGYLQAPQLLLAPYEDGARASARIIHTSSRLWLCLTGLQPNGGYAGLLVDMDNSGEATVQSGDFGYYVKKDGTRFVKQGNGSGFENASAGALSARIFDYGDVWAAELEISKSAFGDWQKRLALAIGHFNQSGNPATTWPHSAERTSPQTWAQTNLGLVAALAAIAPENKVLGTGDIDLTISGANFTTDNVVLWEDTAVSTTMVDGNTLTALVPDSLAPTAGSYDVSVGVAGMDSLTTAATPFIVFNQQPTISNLNPGVAKMGDSGMVVTINGTGFVDGASVVWNGETRPATFVSPTQITFSLATTDLVSAYTVPVVVANPEPSVGPSNTFTFVILSGFEQVFLPLMNR